MNPSIESPYIKVLYSVFRFHVISPTKVSKQLDPLLVDDSNSVTDKNLTFS